MLESFSGSWTSDVATVRRERTRMFLAAPGSGVGDTAGDGDAQGDAHELETDLNAAESHLKAREIVCK